MDVWLAILLIRRRWRIVGIVVMFAVLAAVAAYKTGPTRYFSSSVGLLVAPPTGSTTYGGVRGPNRSNPYYLSDDNLTIASAMLVQHMNTHEFADEIGLLEDDSAHLTVNNGAANPELRVNGPFIFVTVDTSTPDNAPEFVRRAVARASSALRQNQAILGAPSATFITLAEITPPPRSFAVRGSGSRAAGAALLLGLAAAFGAAVIAERIATRPTKGLRSRGPRTAALEAAVADPVADTDYSSLVDDAVVQP